MTTLKIFKLFNTSHLTGLLVGIIGVFILFRGLFLNLNSELLWADNFDPNLILWIVEWGYHIIAERGDWHNFWNANAFYPKLNSLAFSDSLLGLQLFYIPLRIIGNLSPLNSLYLALGCIVISGTSLTNLALLRLNFSTTSRVLIIYIAHFSLPIAGYLPHYQLFGFQFAPPFFLYLYLFLKYLKSIDLLILSVIFSFATMVSTYFAPMGFLVACIITILSKFIYNEGILKKIIIFYKRINLVDVIILFAVFLVFLALFYIQIKPYLIFAKTPIVDINWSEIELYSSRPWSILQPAINSLIYPTFGFSYGYWEKSYFPGLVILTMAIIGLRIAIKKRFNNSLDRFMILLILTSLILSFGPQFHNACFFEGRIIPLPYKFFAEFIPSISSIRSPGRFGMFLTLPLAIFFLIGYKNLLSRLNKFKIFNQYKLIKILYLFLLILVITDNLISYPIYEYTLPNKIYYSNVKKYIKEKEPLAVLPLVKNGHLETIKNYMDQLNGSNIHHGWIISGYGAKSTSELSIAADLDRKFQIGEADFSELLDYFSSISINKVIIILDDYSEDKKINILTSISKFKIIYKEDNKLFIDINSK